MFMGDSMKSLEEIKKVITDRKSFLAEKFNVEKIGVFGSYSRGDENPWSDIDILISLSGPLGWEFIDLKEYLEGLLENGVDLVTMEALKPQLRDSILNEVSFI